MTSRVVVVGAGVTGLSTAYRLLRVDRSVDVEILEAQPAIGGRVGTVRVDGLELDAGPDAFVARRPAAVQLCRELGLELIEPQARGAFAWTDRGLEPLPPTALGIPTDVDALLHWPGLGRRGRLRALSELVRKVRRDEGDEPLGGLLRRRLGDEATEVLAAPLLGGPFGGDVDTLGVVATFPELARWERDFGSLIRGAKAAAEAGRDAGPMFLRPAGGPIALVDALADAVGRERIRTSTSVMAVEAEGTGFVVRTSDGAERSARSIVVATAGPAAAGLLATVAPQASALLERFIYVGTSAVLLIYPRGTAEALPDASGFVVPRDRAPMSAATFVSRMWPRPALGDRAVIRCAVGGANSEDVLEAADEDIIGGVCRHLAAVLPLPERPDAATVVRWPASVPRYEVGHLDRVAAVREALPPGIVVASDACDGVGIADAVRGANEAAERVGAHLRDEPIGAERAR